MHPVHPHPHLCIDCERLNANTLLADLSLELCWEVLPQEATAPLLCAGFRAKPGMSRCLRQTRLAGLAGQRPGLLLCPLWPASGCSECQAEFSLIPALVGPHSWPLIQCLFLCTVPRPGMFPAPRMTSYYFSTKAGKHSRAGGAKQPSVSHMAECTPSRGRHQALSGAQAAKN